MGDLQFIIRPYRSSDREMVFCIAADTAFFGEPVEAFLDDRRLFCEAFYAYYTDLEPQHGFVACTGRDEREQVVGFLMGSVDTARRDGFLVWKILPGIVRKAITGHYRLGKRTWRYAIEQLKAALRGSNPHANLALYPAHMHINLMEAWRGHGLGRQLIERYRKHLSGLRVEGVHLHTTNLNRAACRLYEHAGFHLLEARPTQAWKRWVKKPVENRVYGLRL